MLDKLEVLSEGGRTLVLPLGDYANGFSVLGIDGLGPTAATLVRNKFANVPGSRFYSSSREERNPVVSIGIQPVFGVKTVAELRQDLYFIFAPGTAVTLKIFTDGVFFGTLQGRVETVEPNIFTKDPSVDVSIICFDPDIVSPTSTILSSMSVVGVENPLVVNYEGHVSTGVIFKTTMSETAARTISFRVRSNETVYTTLEFNNNWVAGDQLTIDTRVGRRRAVYVRSGTTRSLFPHLIYSSAWPTLYPGVNHINLSKINGASQAYTVEYQTLYGGV